MTSIQFPSSCSGTQMLWNSISPMHDIPCSRKCSSLLVLFWEASPLSRELGCQDYPLRKPKGCTKFVEGLMDFDIISQVAQTQMINKSCWESGRRGNATERVASVPLRESGANKCRWRSPRGIASREIQHITIRSCDFHRLRCYQIHKEHGSL